MRQPGISSFILYAIQTDTKRIVYAFGYDLLVFRNSHYFHRFLSTSLYICRLLSLLIYRLSIFYGLSVKITPIDIENNRPVK